MVSPNDPVTKVLSLTKHAIKKIEKLREVWEKIYCIL